MGSFTDTLGCEAKSKQNVKALKFDSRHTVGRGFGRTRTLRSGIRGFVFVGSRFKVGTVVPANLLIAQQTTYIDNV